MSLTKLSCQRMVRLRTRLPDAGGACGVKANIVVGARWAYVEIGHRYVFVGIDCLCGVGIDCLFVGID